MKILITGSSGYVGYVLTKHFSDKGIPVVGLDIVKNPVWDGNYQFYQCSITNKEKLKKIFSEEKPTHVIHLAFLMNSLHNVKREYEIDVLGSINVFKAAKKAKSVKQFINLSSASAYGARANNKKWITEEQELRPGDYSYGVNKKKIEEIYNNLDANFKVVNLRMCKVAGPLYNKVDGIISKLHNSPFLLKLSDKDRELQFIHEEDLTSIFDLIVNDKKIEGTYNLAPDSFSTIKELVPDKRFISLPFWLVRSATSIFWKLRLSKVEPSMVNLSTYGIVISPKKLMDRYNYKFKHSTLEGFKDTIAKIKD